MELSPYLEAFRRDLTAAAAPGGSDIARTTAELLAASLESSLRLCLLQALSDAAAEITTKLEHGSVDLRLRGRDAQFVVTDSAGVGPGAPAASSDRRPPTAPSAAAEPPAPDAEPGDLVRISLRLPESVKEAVERAAAAESISVNAWLVRAITHILQSGEPIGDHRSDPPKRGRLGRRITGYAQA
jgi:hypothetical protein